MKKSLTIPTLRINNSLKGNLYWSANFLYVKKILILSPETYFHPYLKIYYISVFTGYVCVMFFAVSHSLQGFNVILTNPHLQSNGPRHVLKTWPACLRKATYETF